MILSSSPLSRVWRKSWSRKMTKHIKTLLRGIVWHWPNKQFVRWHIGLRKSRRKRVILLAVFWDGSFSKLRWQPEECSHVYNIIRSSKLHGLRGSAAYDYSFAFCSCLQHLLINKTPHHFEKRNHSNLSSQAQLYGMYFHNSSGIVNL